MVRAMPQDAPGSLTANETYAVIAFVLHLNQIVPEDAVMDATTLPAVTMPARDRFVPDDRTGGPAIR
jgi:cytochrome c